MTKDARHVRGAPGGEFCMGSCSYIARAQCERTQALHLSGFTKSQRWWCARPTSKWRFGLGLHRRRRSDHAHNPSANRARKCCYLELFHRRHAPLSLPQPHPHEVCYVCSDECPSESQGKQSRPSERIGLTLLPSATRAEEPFKAAG